MKYSYLEVRKRCLKHDEAVKPIYARYVTHTLSTRLVWLMQDASITPNTITFISLIVAFLALPFFAAMTPFSVFVGALLIEFYYVLDAVDGQWARLKDRKSLTGTFFDLLVNYAIQPPLLYAIAWGVLQLNGSVLYLLFGFTAAFSALWVVIMWNMRASVIASYLLTHPQIREEIKEKQNSITPPSGSFLKKVFSWLHKLLVFPWFMHVLTAVSIFSFLMSDCSLFPVFVACYGLLGPVVAILITTRWILTKEIDNSPLVF